MIKARSSDDHLHSDVILEKISEYDIFRHYISGFKEIGVRFKSELRDDKSPTAVIYVWKGRLWYKDHGHPDHSFHCFGYVQHKHQCDWVTTLKLIDSDFGLNLSNFKHDALTTNRVGIKHERQDLSEKVTIISKKSRKWNQEDANFWRQFYVSKEILVRFGVEPISHYWINTLRFNCDSITYSYPFGNRFKIYSPFSKEGKWSSNVSAKDIQGWNQLPKTGDVVLLTSSLKDIMTLLSIGYVSVALQSEMQMPSENLIAQLKGRFKEVLVLYDNDFSKETNPGQMMAHRICKEYNLVNICIPSKYESKDPSDLVRNENRLILKQIIDEQRRLE
jgi:hypothetical protein|tara:strand:- start:1548 stop:2546 length:999 start_codon:yes stop_codon:yes gene_type:complete